MRRLFIMRKDLHMSPGKLAAQVGHCSEVFWLNWIRGNVALRSVSEREEIQPDTGEPVKISEIHYEIKGNVDYKIYEDYICGSIVKTICEARNKSHLLKAMDMAYELGLIEGTDFGLIFDNCMTELIPEEANGTTLTGIWFRPLDDDIAHSISKKYQLYK